MHLSAGSRLGPYEVVSAIGAGGMGEVWRARDTKLGREVALKVLPVLFAADPDRLARFQREAHVLASLNHPHIGAIYGFEESIGIRALVLELVDGPTLADRIAQGPIAIDEALRIARQIAEALEAAHAQGIIHRDLKPANIKLRADGTVKVLDFGLAKALEPAEASGADLANSPTLTARGTKMGLIVGTAAYMAPEQAKGRPVDKRADIWAFGVVLYEMLTGRRMFDGETVTDVLAAVLTSEPDWNVLAPSTPSAVRRLLRRCLEKDPKRRLRDIADAAIEIDEALAGTPADDQSPAVAAAARGSRRPILFAAGALIVAALAGAATWLLKTPPGPTLPISRFIVTLPSGQSLGTLAQPVVAISPDGSQLAYTAGSIYIRDMDRLEVTTVSNPNPAFSPSFSPDGQWIAYYSTGQLMRVPVRGGSPQIVTAAVPSGVTWLDNDTIVFAQADKGIFRVPAGGGTPQILFAVEPPTYVGWPQVLPSGRLLLLSEGRSSTSEQADAVIRALDGNNRQVVLKNVPPTRYVETGHLVYGIGGRLMAVPFDLSSRGVTGDAIPLPEQVNTSTVSGTAQFAWSRTGTLVHIPPLAEYGRLVWVDRRGNVTPAARPLRQYSDPRLSPDGRYAALHLQDEENDVWVGDLARGSLTRVTFDSMEDETPVWSPDGRHIAYAATRSGPTRGVYRRVADVSRPEELLWTSPAHSHVIDWSRDGRTLVIGLLHLDTNNDMLLLDLETRQVRPLMQSRFNDRFGRLSPDGKWIAYSTDESGREEIYVQPFPALDARVQVSTEGGTQPVWSRDGRELFYRTAREVMASTVTSGTAITFGPPHALFVDRFERPQVGDHTTFDVGPDGRFLMIAAPEDAKAGPSARNELHIVLNWFEELKARAPGK